MYRLNSAFVVAGITVLFLGTLAFTVWGGYGKACGSKGQACGTQGTTASCAANEGTAASAMKEASAYPSQGASAVAPMAASAVHGGSAACPASQGSSSAGCAMHGGSAACASQVSAACSDIKLQSSSGFLKSYFEMRELLANDRVKGLDNLSRSLAKQAGKFRKELASRSKDRAATEQLDALKDIENAALTMKSNNLKSARESFKGLSRSVFEYVKSYGCEGSVYSFYCDMVKETWLQETNKIGNPYYGSQMPRCGVMTGHTSGGKYVSGT